MKSYVKITFVCLLIVIDSVLLSAQSSTWFREYPLSYYVQLSSMTKLKNGDLIMSGATYFSPRKISVVRVNQFGDTLWSRLISAEYCSQIAELKDNSLILAGSLEDKSIATKLQANGEILWSKLYNLGNSNSAFRAIYEDSDRSLIFFGMSSFDFHSQTSKSFYLRCTENGDTLQLKQLIQSPGIGKVSQLPGDRFLITAPLSIRGRALICNKNGKIELISEGQFHIGVRDNSSASYYFVRDSIHSGISRSLFVEVLDSNFTDVFDTLISIPGKALYSYDVFGIQGGLLICGNSIDNITAKYSGFIMSFSKEYSSNWFRSYEIEKRTFRLQSITKDQLGKIYSAGSMLSDTNSNSNFCALKADENGVITEVLPSAMVVANSSECSIEVFPNPFNGGIYLKLHVQTEYLVNIEVFDVLGKKVFPEQTMLQMPGLITYYLGNLNLIPTHVYFLVVTLKNKFRSEILTKKIVNLK